MPSNIIIGCSLGNLMLFQGRSNGPLLQGMSRRVGLCVVLSCSALLAAPPFARRQSIPGCCQVVMLSCCQLHCRRGGWKRPLGRGRNHLCNAAAATRESRPASSSDVTSSSPEGFRWMAGREDESRDGVPEENKLCAEPGKLALGCMAAFSAF